MIGLIANVFTAVFVSKFIFDWELSRQTAGHKLEHLTGFWYQSWTGPKVLKR